MKSRKNFFVYSLFVLWALSASLPQVALGILPVGTKARPAPVAIRLAENVEVMRAQTWTSEPISAVGYGEISIHVEYTDGNCWPQRISLLARNFDDETLAQTSSEGGDWRSSNPAHLVFDIEGPEVAVSVFVSSQNGNDKSGFISVSAYLE